MVGPPYLRYPAPVLKLAAVSRGAIEAHRFQIFFQGSISICFAENLQRDDDVDITGNCGAAQQAALLELGSAALDHQREIWTFSRARVP